MARPIGLAVALVVLVGLSGVAAGQAVGSNGGGGMVTVTVTVVDPAGDPIRGVELSASWDGGSTSDTTAANGQALLDLPEGAAASISVQHGEYVRNNPIEVASVSGDPISITAYPKAEATVTVVDENGPVTDAKVQFRKRGRVAAGGSTDATGTVGSGVVEAGEYGVSVFKPGYYRTTVRLTVGAGTSREVRIEQGFVDVEFRVRDDNFNPPRPVEGATISGSGIGSVKTQSNGIQRVSLPVNSRVEVTIAKDGYRMSRRTVDVGEQARQLDVTTRKKGRLTLDIAPERVVVGEPLRVGVTDSYGTPMVDATVYLDGRSVGQPDENGEILVPIESPGKHEVHAEIDGSATEPIAVTGVIQRTETPVPTTPTPSMLESSFGESVVGFPVDIRSTGLGLGVGIVLTLAGAVGWKVRRWTRGRQLE